MAALPEETRIAYCNAYLRCLRKLGQPTIVAPLSEETGTAYCNGSTV